MLLQRDLWQFHHFIWKYHNTTLFQIEMQKNVTDGFCCEHIHFVHFHSKGDQQKDSEMQLLKNIFLVTYIDKKETLHTIFDFRHLSQIYPTLTENSTDNENRVMRLRKRLTVYTLHCHKWLITTDQKLYEPYEI